jgi:hypothetical protein
VAAAGMEVAGVAAVAGTEVVGAAVAGMAAGGEAAGGGVEVVGDGVAADGDGDRVSPSALPCHQPITIHHQPTIRHRAIIRHQDTTRRHTLRATTGPVPSNPRATMAGLSNNTGTLRATTVALCSNPTMPTPPQRTPTTVAHLTSQGLALIEYEPELRGREILCVA